MWLASDLCAAFLLSLEPCISPDPRQFMAAEWWSIQLLLTLLTSSGCSLFSCNAPSVDTAVWQRQGRELGKPVCWLYRPSQGAGPGGTPRSLKYLAYCVLDPPMKIWLILQTRPLSCLQCESSARGQENGLSEVVRWVSWPRWTFVREVWSRRNSYFSCELYIFKIFISEYPVHLIRLIQKCWYSISVCVSWLSSVGWWVSEGSICPLPLPELAKRELIFIGHRLYFVPPPEVKIQFNSRSIQERSSPRWYNKLCSLPINILLFIISCLKSNKAPVKVCSVCNTPCLSGLNGAVTERCIAYYK